MSETKVPGLKSGHAIITPTCRANRTLDGAFDEAVERLRRLYQRYASADANAGANWHLVLTVEVPDAIMGECPPHPLHDWESALGGHGLVQECSRCGATKPTHPLRTEAATPVDRSNTGLSGGGSVTADHADINPATGMQKGYVVLTPEERAKGFVRPVRRTYVHVGVRPKFPTRELTAEEQERYASYGYVLYEEYPESEAPKVGRFWTQQELNSGCNAATTTAQDIAETYARDPKFYDGTFCVGCRMHRPLAEFVWADTDERVGS